MVEAPRMAAWQPPGAFIGRLTLAVRSRPDQANALVTPSSFLRVTWQQPGSRSGRPLTPRTEVAAPALQTAHADDERDATSLRAAGRAAGAFRRWRASY